jgi:hypothetical protein
LNSQNTAAAIIGFPRAQALGYSQNIPDQPMPKIIMNLSCIAIYLAPLKVSAAPQAPKPPSDLHVILPHAQHLGAVDGHAYIFMANFTGLVPHQNAVPATLQNCHHSTTELNGKTLQRLPFLGTIQTLTGRRMGDRTVFTLPSLERGAVAWIQ